MGLVANEWMKIIMSKIDPKLYMCVEETNKKCICLIQVAAVLEPIKST